MSWHGPSWPRLLGMAEKAMVVAICLSKAASTAASMRSRAPSGRAMTLLWDMRSERLDNGHVGHAAALAHGLEAIPQTLRPERMHEGGHQLGAGGAQGVSQRDGAAVDVEPVGVGAQLLEPCKGHRGEGLIDFVEVDVAEPHAGPGERPPGGRDRLLQHDYRVAGGDRQMMDAGERLQPMLLQGPLVHHQRAGGAVA